jgi:type IV pilus assembly protein PilE
MSPRGLTLLELLVVLVVVGVVAALALPAYHRHLMRVNRTDATIALYQLAAAEESHYLRQGRYSNDLLTAPPSGLGLPVDSTARRYRLSVALAADAQSYIATATPTREGGQESDTECLAFSLDHRGRRAVSGRGDVGRCWR